MPYFLTTARPAHLHFIHIDHYQNPVPALIKANSVRQHDYRTFLVINTIAYLGIGVHFLLIPLFYLLNLERLAFINLFSFLAWVLAWRINNSGNHQWAIGLMICEVFVHTVLVVPIMGWNSGFQYYLIGSIPFTRCSSF